MKKSILLFIIAITLFSCKSLISDDLIIVHSKHKIDNGYYKYFYKCYQNGLKLKIYSSSEYTIGQPLIIK